MTYPDNIIYSKDHIWLKPNGDSYILGITDFAQDLLGDIVYVEINKNSEFRKNQALGTIESVKTASDIIAPENGKIILTTPNYGGIFKFLQKTFTKNVFDKFEALKTIFYTFEFTCFNFQSRLQIIM